MAAVTATVQYLCHALLFLTATPHRQEETRLIEAMKAYHRGTSGFDHSYWDFYFGYGLLAILYGTVEVALLFVLAALAKSNSFRLRPSIAVFIAANMLHAVLILNYFFLLPATFDLVVSLLLVAAFFAAKSGKAAPTL
ncbi:MAG TPA: hypothetical protein VKQ08_12530 [Cyclobacteriaceae bacterium]|nr:hypothetical protein [Cyclobacteriaceae bacterium]